jgi:hypothetical protein
MAAIARKLTEEQQGPLAKLEQGRGGARAAGRVRPSRTPVANAMVADVWVFGSVVWVAWDRFGRVTIWEWGENEP